jgi:hypothetical protein
MLRMSRNPYLDAFVIRHGAPRGAASVLIGLLPRIEAVIREDSERLAVESVSGPPTAGAAALTGEDERLARAHGLRPHIARQLVDGAGEAFSDALADGDKGSLLRRALEHELILPPDLGPPAGMAGPSPPTPDPHASSLDARSGERLASWREEGRAAVERLLYGAGSSRAPGAGVPMDPGGTARHAAASWLRPAAVGLCFLVLAAVGFALWSHSWHRRLEPHPLRSDHESPVITEEFWRRQERVDSLLNRPAEKRAEYRADMSAARQEASRLGDCARRGLEATRRYRASFPIYSRPAGDAPERIWRIRMEKAAVYARMCDFALRATESAGPDLVLTHRLDLLYSDITAADLRIERLSAGREKS